MPRYSNKTDLKRAVRDYPTFPPDTSASGIHVWAFNHPVADTKARRRILKELTSLIVHCSIHENEGLQYVEPTHDWIAKHRGVKCSRRTVINALNHFRKHGVLTWEKCYTAEHGGMKQTGNVYILDGWETGRNEH